MSPVQQEGGAGAIDLEGGSGDDLLLEGEEEGEADTGVGGKVVCCYRRRRR